MHELRVERPTLEDLFVQITEEVEPRRGAERGQPTLRFASRLNGPRRSPHASDSQPDSPRVQCVLLSPIAYVVLAVFLAVTGHLFYLTLDN